MQLTDNADMIVIADGAGHNLTTRFDASLFKWWWK